MVYSINPQNGLVQKAYDLASLKRAESLFQTTYFNYDSSDVLNGLAYVSAEDAFYVTGKKWNLMFKIQFK